MTFDDGILGLYTREEVCEPGEQPHDVLTLYDRFHFSYASIGIQRYYTALQAGQQVDAVVNIPGWYEIPAEQYIVVIAHEDGTLDDTCAQYRVLMVQPQRDTYDLRMTKLTLERIRDNYAHIS